MRRNFLSREQVDGVDCLLAGAAFSLVKLLNWLKIMPIMVWLVISCYSTRFVTAFYRPKAYS